MEEDNNKSEESEASEEVTQKSEQDIQPEEKTEEVSDKDEEIEESIEETEEPESEKADTTENAEVSAKENDIQKETIESEATAPKEDIALEKTADTAKEEATADKAKEQKKEKHKNNKKVVVISVVAVAVIIIAMIFSVIFALLNISNTKILNGVSILGIDVSGLSTDEATERVNDAIEAKFSDENDSIILKHNELETSVNANTFNAKFDVDTAVAEAYNIGRSGNIITNNYAILSAMLFQKNIEPELYYDEEFMTSTISDINAKMTDGLVEYSYYIEDTSLFVVKGTAGYVIKTEELTEKIVEQLKSIHTPYEEIEIPVEYQEPGDVDLEAIRNEIYKEPKDAYVEENPTVVHVEENGIDFAISIEEAEALLEEEQEEYEIPLAITAPEKTLEDLGEEAFPDQLATFSTIYDASATNRAYNIELATEKINGTIIMPGETFSFNKTVGSRTIEEGWKEGTAYISGQIVPSVGGGVCQVSSTLYNAAVLANLEITERTNHSFTVSYVSASRDATVYYGSLDFCFKNTRTYPVKIVATAQNGVCKISLYGIKEEVEYEVIIQSKVTSYISYTTTYIDDPTLEEGVEVVEQAGFNGCRSEGYKILKLNGKVVSQTLLSKDTYSAQERIVRRGTKATSSE